MKLGEGLLDEGYCNPHPGQKNAIIEDSGFQNQNHIYISDVVLLLIRPVWAENGLYKKCMQIAFCWCP